MEYQQQHKMEPQYTAQEVHYQTQPQYASPQIAQNQTQPQYASPQIVQNQAQPQYAPAQNVHQQPQPQYAVAQNVHSQEWQNSLMDCGPCDLCLLGTCLPCVLVGQTSERIRDPTMQTYETFNTDCLMMCGISYLTGCGWIYAMIKRGEIRERYGIKGDGTSDCCTAYWCACCALIQQEKEVKARTSAGPITQAYQSPKQGMQMHQ